MPLNENIVQSVSESNFKTIADAPAYFMAQTYALSHENNSMLSKIGQSNLGVILNNLNSFTASEAKAENTLLTDNSVAQAMVALSAALAANQQQVKTAQTTPPVTP